MHCDLRVRWKVASDLRFRGAISEPKTPSFCGISSDLAPSTRKSLAIAIVRFWCAKHSTHQEVVQGKSFLNFLHFSGVVCLITPFSNTSALTSSLLFRANSPCKGSRTPRFVEHFWVPILGVSCSNKLFVGNCGLPKMMAHAKGVMLS